MPYSVAITTQALAANINLDDDAQKRFQTNVANLAQQTLTQTNTSYALYQSVAGAILQNAAQNDFLNKEFQYLKMLGNVSEPNKSIVFGLTDSDDNSNDNGQSYFKDVELQQKRSALDSYFKHLLDSDVAPKVHVLYQSNGPYKSVDSGQPPVLVDSLANVRQQHENYKFSGNLDSDINQYDQFLSTLLASPPQIYKDLLTAATTAATSFNTGAGKALLGGLRNLLNQRIPISLTLADILLDEVRKNCLKSPQAVISNKGRVNLILLKLGYTGDLNVDLSPSRGNGPFAQGLELAKQRLRELAQNGQVTVDHLSGALLYSDPSQILVPAANRLATQIYADVGLTSLKEASLLSYVTDRDSIVARLVTELAGTVNALLNLLHIQVLWNGGVIEEFKALKPLIFYDLNDYRSAMGRMSHSENYDEDKQTYITLPNSIDVPLLDLAGSSFLFYNCGDFLYLNDTIAPESVCLNVQGDKKGTWSLIDAKKNKDRSATRDQIIKDLRCRTDFDLKLRRTYVSLYCLRRDLSAIDPNLMWLKTSGLADGIGRADGVEDGYYRWSFKGNVDKIKQKLRDLNQAVNLSNFDARVLGAFMGLESRRFYGNPNTFTEKGANGFTYMFLPEDAETPGDDDLNFVLCNSPYHTTLLKTPVSGMFDLGLEDFQFYYFRFAAFGGGAPATRKAVKAADWRRNRPRMDDVPDDCKTPNQEHFGVNLPVCLNLEANYQRFRDDKRERAPIKNKGNFLGRNVTFRKDAGKVMAAIASYAGMGQPSSLSANTLVAKVIPAAKALADWQSLKVTKLSQLPTDQEWCHLQGHGDNGSERVGNFVSGSKHCNTEQLAIESAQRPVTTKVGNAATFQLKSTAYLVKDNTMKEKVPSTGPPSCYLGVDPDYRANAYTNNPKNKGVNADKLFVEDYQRFKSNAPVAAFIRYKILRRETTNTGAVTYRKVFDYIFEGQSEFFDANQYNILYYTVYFLLDQQGFLQELLDFYLTKYLKVDEIWI
jgi:hypothetical protein